MKTSFLDWLAILFAVVGAITWGVLGLTGLAGDPLNIVNLALEPVFRPDAAQIVEYLIYVLVGLSGVYLLYTASKMGRASRRTTREHRRNETATRTDTTRENTTRDNTGTENNS